jgi:hypothetical protein
MPRQVTAAVATLGIDIGKNVFHLIGQNERGAIALRLRLSRAQVQCGSPTCPHAWLAWKPASVRIISATKPQPSATTSG